MLRTLLAISRIPGIADAFIRKNIDAFSFANPELTRTYISALSPKITPSLIEEHLPWADSVISKCEKLGITIIPIYDNRYPAKLKAIGNPPAVLYLKGNLDLLKKVVIAVIGTRHSSVLGNTIANRVGTYFSKEHVLCNGLADGIDKYSIVCGNGVYPNVIGVLSSGLNYKYSASSITASLADKTLNCGGLLISEVEPDQKENQYSGSRSSRIQAGLSSGLILVQSSISGGSKYTLKAISRLNRVIGVIVYNNNTEYEYDISFSGNRLLEREGMAGLAKMCEIKNLKTLMVKNLIKISSVLDYERFIQSLSNSLD